MKNFKTLLSVFAVAAAFSVAANAQVSDNVAVAAEVQAAITVNTSTDINLGTIQTGVASVIKANANDGAVEANLGTGATAGQVDVTGTASASVQIDFTGATVDNGSDPIAFSNVVYNGASAITTGGTTSLDGSGDLTLDIGGSLAAPSGTGTYNTSTGGGSPITLTVTYN